MQLEALLTSLGISQHSLPLSEWRDDLLREKAAELQSVRNAVDDEHVSQVEALNAEIANLKNPANRPAPAPGDVSKLTLMRRLVALGKWGEFKALLKQLPELTQDAWTLAGGIRADDPLFVEAAPTIKAALGLTDAEFDSLLE